MRRATAILVTLAFLAVGGPLTGTASAAVVSCGQTITQTTTLTADVGPCSGDGIVIGANNITLNLNGHRIAGNADQGASGEFAGILLSMRTGVTIIGAQGRGIPGTVSGFEAGVLINGGSGNTVQGLTVVDNTGIPDVEVANLGDGIILFSSANNRLLKNTLARNGPFDGIGVLGFGSNGNLVQANLVSDTTFVECLQTGVGIIVNPVITFPSPTPGTSVFNNQVISNWVRNNGGAGISNLSSVNGVVRGNLVEGNGILDFCLGNGIGFRANQQATQVTNGLIEKNRIRNNGLIGLDVVSAGNRVLKNEITGHMNDAGMFVVVPRLGPYPPSVISANKVADNLGGMGVFGAFQNSEISYNIVTNSQDRGLVLAANPSLPLSGRPHHNRVFGNQIHGHAFNGLELFAAESNDIRYNDASNNALSDPFSHDLVDGYSDCDSNNWFGNTWGSGGFDPPCTATGGTGPAVAASAAESESRTTAANSRALVPPEEKQPLVRRRPPV